ncbi:CPBP family intramembrane metalloprotease [Oceanospirillaceae bacterium]|nr:CPBP family intramembrane metalloprotease [Oceanospirillaceae bacterium]
MNRLSVFLSAVGLVFISIVSIKYANTLPVVERKHALYVTSFIQLFFVIGAYFYVPNKIKDFFLVKSSNGHYSLSLRVLRVFICTGNLLTALVIVFSFTSFIDIIQIDIDALIWLFFYQLILISVVEEVIFRGLIFGCFPKHSLQAIIVSSALFSLYHWNNGLSVLPYYFSIGILLAVFRHFGFPLYALIIWHALFNTTILSVFPFVEFRFSSLAYYVVVPLAFVCLSALSGWILVCNNKQS